MKRMVRTSQRWYRLLHAISGKWTLDKMKLKKLKLRIAEVTHSDRVDEYQVIAQSNLHARDLMVRHLTGDDEWSNIRVEDVAEARDGPERVLGKISSRKRDGS